MCVCVCIYGFAQWTQLSEFVLLLLLLVSCVLLQSCWLYSRSCLKNLCTLLLPTPQTRPNTPNCKELSHSGLNTTEQHTQHTNVHTNWTYVENNCAIAPRIIAFRNSEMVRKERRHSRKTLVVVLRMKKQHCSKTQTYWNTTTHARNSANNITL